MLALMKVSFFTIFYFTFFINLTLLAENYKIFGKDGYGILKKSYPPESENKYLSFYNFKEDLEIPYKDKIHYNFDVLFDCHQQPGTRT